MCNRAIAPFACVSHQNLPPERRHALLAAARVCFSHSPNLSNANRQMHICSLRHARARARACIQNKYCNYIYFHGLALGWALQSSTACNPMAIQSHFLSSGGRPPGCDLLLSGTPCRLPGNTFHTHTHTLLPQLPQKINVSAESSETYLQR